MGNGGHDSNSSVSASEGRGVEARRKERRKDLPVSSASVLSRT